MGAMMEPARSVGQALGEDAGVASYRVTDDGEGAPLVEFDTYGLDAQQLRALAVKLLAVATIMENER